MKNTTENLTFLIEKHLAIAKDFKGKSAGEDSRQLAQFLVELLAYRKRFAEWREKIDENCKEI